MEVLRTRQTWLTLVMQRIQGWGMNLVEHLQNLILREQIMWACLLPYEIISKDEVITVDENPGNVAAEEDHDNAHEDEGQIDLALDRVPCSHVRIPAHTLCLSFR